MEPVEHNEDWELVRSRKLRSSPTSDDQSNIRSPPQGFLPVTGTKRPRSPPACNHCLRTTHKTSECRHRLSCKRCGGAGHMAANCRVEIPSPPRHRRVRPKAKASTSQFDTAAEENQRKAGDSSLTTNRQRSQISLSLTQETSKLRKDLAKIIVLDVISGQTSEDILLEFLPGALNTPRVDAVYDFKGNSYLATLSCEAEAIKACKIGELSLPSKMGPCVISIKPWSAEIGSVGSATGKAQVLLIWNLPLHAWTWTVLVDFLKPIGELVAIPQPSKPHKSFISVLVRCRPRVVLPHEVVLSFGMRKYIVMITDNHLPFPTYRRDLEKYVVTLPKADDSPRHISPPPLDNDRSADLKGKDVFQDAEHRADSNKITHGGRTSQQFSQIWRPRSQSTRPESTAPGVPLCPSETARPVSVAPGAMNSLPETRPESLAPGVEGTRPIVLAARRPASRRTLGSEISNKDNARQVLPSFQPTLHASNQPLHELQCPYSGVDHVLVEETANSGGCSYKEKKETAEITTRGDSFKPLSRDDQLTPSPLHHVQIDQVPQGPSLSHDQVLKGPGPNLDPCPTQDQRLDQLPHGPGPTLDPSPGPTLDPCPTQDQRLDQLPQGPGPTLDPCPTQDQSLDQSTLGSSPTQEPISGLVVLGPPYSAENNTKGPDSRNSLEPEDSLYMAQAQPANGKELNDSESFCNPAQPPSNFSPPPNFNWVFLHGCWTLVPCIFTKEISTRSLQEEDSLQQGHIEIWNEENQVDDPEHIVQISEGSGHDGDSVESHEYEDSESDFEEKIRRLLHTGQAEDPAHGTRRSERKKKPSSRWNEEAGFIPQPPRSSKKKGTSSTTPEAPDSKRSKLEEPMSKIKRSLEFTTSRFAEQEDPSVPPSSLGEI
ncbi:Aldehyde dehydrogenase N-terminal protein [Dioscorea alata]|uniref:Aldehyde dehydrogenase N-terminal protein n=1 Tax=Dioscorea alata TaxID=55571 RepID=A0ACB7V1V5_DIOAL|nr:Aldehyde dehydrogenase N-terminal protein [Dioscorea alata]